MGGAAPVPLKWDSAPQHKMNKKLSGNTTVPVKQIFADLFKRLGKVNHQKVNGVCFSNVKHLMLHLLYPYISDKIVLNGDKTYSHLIEQNPVFDQDTAETEIPLLVERLVFAVLVLTRGVYTVRYDVVPGEREGKTNTTLQVVENPLCRIRQQLATCVDDDGFFDKEKLWAKYEEDDTTFPAALVAQLLLASEAAKENKDKWRSQPPQQVKIPDETNTFVTRCVRHKFQDINGNEGIQTAALKINPDPARMVPGPVGTNLVEVGGSSSLIFGRFFLFCSFIRPGKVFPVENAFKIYQVAKLEGIEEHMWHWTADSSWHDASYYVNSAKNVADLISSKKADVAAIFDQQSDARDELFGGDMEDMEASEILAKLRRAAWGPAEEVEKAGSDSDSSRHSDDSTDGRSESDRSCKSDSDSD